MSYNSYWSRQQREMSDFYQRQNYYRMQQENERRMREMQQAANQRQYEETQREMQRHNEEMRRQFEAEQRVTNLILQQSHNTTSYSSSTSSYMSEAELKQRRANIQSIPAMCKPYEERLLALIEQKYIELRTEHDKFRAEFLAKNPGQEMKCKPLMERETSFLGITIKPADRDKWYSIIGGEYLRSLKYTDDGRKMGTGYSGRICTFSSTNGDVEYKIALHHSQIKLSKYFVTNTGSPFSLCSPLYENGLNKRAPISNNIDPESRNFTIVSGQIVRTQPTFQPLPPHLRSWTFEAIGGKQINCNDIDRYSKGNKLKEMYRD